MWYNVVYYESVCPEHGMSPTEKALFFSEVIMAQLLASATLVWQYVLGSILIVLAIALIFLVLKQSGKEKGLSGTIAGGAETYFGKNQGQSTDKKLSKATIVLSIVLVVITVALTVLAYRYGLGLKTFRS